MHMSRHLQQHRRSLIYVFLLDFCSSRLSSSVYCIQGCGYCGQRLYLAVIIFTGGESSDPVYRGASAPLVWWSGKYFSRGSSESLGHEIVKGTIHVAESGSAFCTVKGSFDHRIAPRRQSPRAGEICRNPDI